jgi:transposase-like protein
MSAGRSFFARSHKICQAVRTDHKPYRHRFPISIIQHALWLYHRIPLSYRDVQELLQERGIKSVTTRFG